MTQKVDQNETTAIIFDSGGKWIKKKERKKNTQIISCAHENL